MVLVDSSVWIDYLGHQTSSAASRLEELIKPENRVVITGIIYQEVLQGIRNHKSFLLTQKLLGYFPFVIPTLFTHVKAAHIFKKLALKGKILSTIDTLIAALAIENRVSLFTLDKSFRHIEISEGLQLF